MFLVGDDPISIVTLTETVEIKNEVVIIPPRFNHYANLNENAVGVLFDFKLATKGEDSAFSFLSEIQSSGEIKRYPFNERLGMLTEYFRSIRVEYSEKNQAKRTALHTVIFLEIAGIAKPMTQDGEAQVGGYTNDYTKTIHSILSHEYMNDIDLGYVAERLHLSLRQTTRIFRKSYGQSFSDLLLERRLTVASVHLTHSMLKISDIIELVGFKTSNYFFSSFKKKYGMTPHAYRNKYNIFVK